MLVLRHIRMEGETAVLDTLPRSGGQPQTIMGSALAAGEPAGRAPQPPDRAQVAAAVARYQALREFRARLYRCLTVRPDAAFELVDGAPRGAVVPDGGERPSIASPS